MMTDRREYKIHDIKSQTEPNLILIVRELLIEKGLINNVLANYDTSDKLLECLNKNIMTQIQALNTFWNIQLLYYEKISNIDTTNLRLYSLINNPNAYTLWLRSFKTDLLNFIVNNNLPTTIRN